MKYAVARLWHVRWARHKRKGIARRCLHLQDEFGSKKHGVQHFQIRDPRLAAACRSVLSRLIVWVVVGDGNREAVSCAQSRATCTKGFCRKGPGFGGADDGGRAGVAARRVLLCSTGCLGCSVVGSLRRAGKLCFWVLIERGKCAVHVGAICILRLQVEI